MACDGSSSSILHTESRYNEGESASDLADGVIIFAVGLEAFAEPTLPKHRRLLGIESPHVHTRAAGLRSLRQS